MIYPQFYFCKYFLLNFVTILSHLFVFWFNIISFCYISCSNIIAICYISCSNIISIYYISCSNIISICYISCSNIISICYLSHICITYLETGSWILLLKLSIMLLCCFVAIRTLYSTLSHYD